MISKRHYPAALAAGVVVLGGLLLWPRKTASAPGPSPVPGPGPSPGLPAGPLPPGTTALTSYLPDDFFRGVIKLTDYANSKGATLKPEDFLAVFLAESDVKPTSINGIGCAGLNQICNLHGVGFPQEKGYVGDKFAWAKLSKSARMPFIQQYAALSAVEQLEYVKRFFDGWNHYPKFVNYGALYMANFTPGYLDHANDPTWVIARKSPDDDGSKAYAEAHPKQFYPGNAGIDIFPKKGYIEVADMTRFVDRAVGGSRAKFNEMRMRLANVRASV